MTHTQTARTDQGSYWVETTAGPIEIWPLSAVQAMATAGQPNNTEEASDPITINQVEYHLRLTLTRVEALAQETRIMEAVNNFSNGSNPLGSPDRVWAESNGWARTFGSRYGTALRRADYTDATAAAQRHLNGPLLDQITAALELMGPELALADEKARAGFVAGCWEKVQEARVTQRRWETLAESVEEEGLALASGWLMRSELSQDRGPRDWVLQKLTGAIKEEARG